MGTVNGCPGSPHDIGAGILKHKRTVYWPISSRWAYLVDSIEKFMIPYNVLEFNRQKQNSIESFKTTENSRIL